MKKVQTLNEEIQKMRRLMSFNINENSHDSLSEENFDNSTKGENTDPLQKECGGTYSGPKRIAFVMAERINELLIEKVDYYERLKKIKIDTSYADMENGIKPIILFEDDNPGTFERESVNQYAFDITGEKIDFAEDFPVSSVREELLNSDKCFRMVYERYDAIKHQIDNSVIKMELYPLFNHRNIRMEMLVYDGKQKLNIAGGMRLKRALRKGTGKLLDKNNLTIYDLHEPFFIDLGDGMYGYVNCEFRTILTGMKLDGANVPDGYGEPECFCNDVDTGERIKYLCGSPLPERCKRGRRRPIAFKFVVDASKNFEKDQAILTQEAKDVINQNIVKKWDDLPQYRKEEYLEFLSGKTVTVNAYASIDALSNFPDGGRYAGCSTYGVGKGPRVDYNQCLSEARANAVVAHLKTIADGAFANVNFVAVGKGETNEWSGLVWDQLNIPLTKDVKSPYSEEELRPDRRFDIAFPEYDKVD